MKLIIGQTAIALLAAFVIAVYVGMAAAGMSAHSFLGVRYADLPLLATLLLGGSALVFGLIPQMPRLSSTPHFPHYCLDRLLHVGAFP